MSLWLKFLLFLVTVPSISLLAFLYNANIVFVDDKISSIFDNSQRTIEQLGTLIKSDWDGKQSISKIARSASSNNALKMSPEFDQALSQSGLIQVWTYQNGTNNRIQLGPPLINLFKKKPVINEAKKNILSKNSAQFFFKFKNQNYLVRPQENFIELYLLDGIVGQAIKEAELFSIQLTDINGEILISSDETSNFTNISEYYSPSLVNRVQDSQFTLESFEFPGRDGPAIFSFKYIKGLDLMLISSISKETALRASKIFIYKSIGTLAIILSLAVILSIIFSTLLTMNVAKLKKAMHAVGQGDLDTRVHIKSKDELGQLGAYFNQFIEKLSLLMQESKEKVEIEKDLEIASTVQDTLMPNVIQKNSAGRSKTFYQPAQYCGGDWWFTYSAGGKVIYMIADATGHGVSAALTTAAARSAVALLELGAETAPEKIMQDINRAIFKTIKGTVNMTFFISVFDPETMSMEYCNASHEPPFIARLTNTPLSFKDLIPLSDTHGARVGEEFDTKYSATKIKMEKNDFILFYTDGFFELDNKKGTPLSESQFLRAVARQLNNNSSPEAFIDKLSAELMQPNKDKQLVDDLALIALKLS